MSSGTQIGRWHGLVVDCGAAHDPNPAVGRVKRVRGHVGVSPWLGLVDAVGLGGGVLGSVRASTLTYATCVDHGHLASFGLPWWRRAGRQASRGVTLAGPP